MSEQKPQSPPSVDDIPQATQLHEQLNTLNRAIAVLSVPGAGIGSLWCIPAPPPPAEPSDVPLASPQSQPMESVTVMLRPPITKPETIADLVAGLQGQAAAIEAQLATMGYTASRRSKAS